MLRQRPGCSVNTPGGNASLSVDPDRPPPGQSWQFSWIWIPRGESCFGDEVWSGMHPHLHSPRRGLPGTAAASVRSCDRPHCVRGEGGEVFFLRRLSFVKVVNLILLFLSTAVWFIGRTLLFVSLRSWFCDDSRCLKGIVVRDDFFVPTNKTFVSYLVGTSPTEVDLMAAEFSQKFTAISSGTVVGTWSINVLCNGFNVCDYKNIRYGQKYLDFFTS